MGRVAEQNDRHQLQVLIASDQPERLDRLEAIVHGLGYQVAARATDPAQVAAGSLQDHSDVAVIGLGESSEHALALIGEATSRACCPVIAVLHTSDRDFIEAAAKRGIFAAVAEDDPGELQRAIEIALVRFAAFRNLEGAFGRRAVIERAKGILMERNHIDERQAFELLSRQSQNTGRKLAEIAQAVIVSHLLLPSSQPQTQTARRQAEDGDPAV